MPEHSTADASVDVSGLACPQPVAAVRRRLERLDPGETLVVEGADAAATGSIHRACEKRGFDVASDGEALVIRVTDHSSL